jgi:hypothetical protein
VDNILEMWEKAPNGEELAKALMQEKEERKKAAQPKSAIIDPTNTFGLAGTRSKQALVNFNTLRRMAAVPAIAAILLTRKNQVGRFARRPRFDGDVGFKLGLKDTRKKMSDAQQKRAHELEEFFLKTGAVKNRKRKDNFNTFLRKIVDDTLTLDVMAWENVPNLGGGLSELWAVDSTTIELVSVAPTSEERQPIVYVPQTKRGMTMGGDIAYVQRLDGQIVAEYTEDELAYAIRNPRTDILTTDFGMSELEVLMEIVTGILNGVRYNTSYFTHSHMPQGVLSLVGNYKDEHLDAFKRHWKQLTSGASGKWATPVMAVKEGAGVSWTPFKQSNQDMQFNEFLEFLFNVACAVYQIDPNEVGFKSWTSGSGMAQTDNTAEKMDKSKDKGLIPLMNFLSDTFNSEIVDQLDDEFAFSWVGLDEDDEDRKMDRQKSEIESGVKTVAMVWAENDVDIDAIKKDNGGELPKWATAPANAQLIQVFMAESGLGQQGQEPGADPNDPNAEATIQQDQADDQHEKGKELSDDGHEKELEKMDKQHELTMEQKEADQSHQLKMETMKQKAAKDSQAQAAKDKPKPSEGKDAKADNAPDPDDQHDKELEKMDVKHKHDVELEKVKQKGKPKTTVKKSLTEPSEVEDEGGINITISWGDY